MIYTRTGSPNRIVWELKPSRQARWLLLFTRIGRLEIGWKPFPDRSFCGLEMSTDVAHLKFNRPNANPPFPRYAREQTFTKNPDYPGHLAFESVCLRLAGVSIGRINIPLWGGEKD